MSKKKIMIIVVAALAVITVLAFAIPALASDSGANQSTQTTQSGPRKAILRLLLVRDESKVDSLLSQAVDSGKITADQSAKIKNFWTEHHTRFTRNVVLRRLLTAKDESKVQAFLDKAVQAGKINSDQADKVIKTWEILHSPAPAAATN